MDKTENEVREIAEGTIVAFAADFGRLAYPLGLLSPDLSRAVKSIATDGEGIYFSAEYLLRCVAESGNFTAPLIHTLAHVLFLHPFAKEKGEFYNLACDIAVGGALDDIKVRWGRSSDAIKRKAVYKSIIDEYKAFNERTAERFLSRTDEKTRAEYEKLFVICDHFLWDEKSEDKEKTVEKWKAVSAGLIGDPALKSERFTSLLRAAARGKGDYARFLLKFLKKREKMLSDPDEFDNIYYCLGLERYGNMPLIESLEYREDRSVSDIVVAIDTSGSTKGEPVVRFLEETYALITQATRRGERYRLRIMQCDAAVTDDITVGGDDEFRKLMNNFKIIGGGGTDFRPVFDKLTKEKKNGKKIKGIIYFTDGRGIFPDSDPGIDPCFALYGDGAEKIKTSVYAHRIEIGDNEL
ncbi:MAG: hypothetical protein IJS67_02380 [Clostridia bacterium]|nr:hypothetical protein [Clostridia bacterium]